MNTTLRELLKPPFVDGKSERTLTNGHICIQLHINTDCDRGQIKRYIANALNEYQRIYGEPKRWIIGREGRYFCPECGNQSERYKMITICCPSCGVKLDPLEGT